MNRKDEHIKLALSMTSNEYNDFDCVRFIHHSVPTVDVREVDLFCEFDGIVSEVPFFINAITGGSEWTTSVNQQLAQVANKTGLIMASG